MGQTILSHADDEATGLERRHGGRRGLDPLTFAVSPPLALLPPGQVAVAVADSVMSQQTVGAAATETFEGRIEAADEAG
jgi:hypothetical protein